MNGREFVRRAHRYARDNGLECYFEPNRGKGSHGKITLGGRATTVQHGEIPLGTLLKMIRDLHIRRGEF